MADKAQISSVDALESFRAKLIVFLSQTRPVLEEASNEMARTRFWLQEDQRRHWEQEQRRRERKLEEAKQELFSATLSTTKGGTTALLHMAVQRAQRAVQEAEAKLKLLRRWDMELDNRAAPLMKQIDQMRGFLTTDMGRAVAYLDNILKALDAYRNVAPVRGGPTTSEPATSGEPT